MRDLPVYQNGNFWVHRTKDGSYEVYENVITHSKLRDIIGFSGQRGFERAKQRADERAAYVLAKARPSQ